jgi:hypothetical protein
MNEDTRLPDVHRQIQDFIRVERPIGKVVKIVVPGYNEFFELWANNFCRAAGTLAYVEECAKLLDVVVERNF